MNKSILRLLDYSNLIKITKELQELREGKELVKIQIKKDRLEFCKANKNKKINIMKSFLEIMRDQIKYNENMIRKLNHHNHNIGMRAQIILDLLQDHDFEGFKREVYSE